MFKWDKPDSVDSITEGLHHIVEDLVNLERTKINKISLTKNYISELTQIQAEAQQEIDRSVAIRNKITALIN